MNETINRFSSTIAPVAFTNTQLKSCRYDAVFFDLDGTLVDTIPHICESYQQTYRAFNLPVPDDATIMGGIGMPLIDFVRATVPAELVDSFIRDYRSYNQGDARRMTAVFWTAKAILENLKNLGVPLGVVTAKMSGPAWQNLNDFGLGHYFDVLVGHDDTDSHKPDPTPLFVGRDKLSKHLGKSLDIKNILYVGDSRFDVACANNAAAPAALVQWTRMPLEPINEAGEYFILYQAEDLQ